MWSLFFLSGSNILLWTTLQKRSKPSKLLTLADATNMELIRWTGQGSNEAGDIELRDQQICPTGSYYARMQYTTKIAPGNEFISFTAKNFDDSKSFQISFTSTSQSPFTISTAQQCLDGSTQSNPSLSNVPIAEWTYFRFVDLLVQCAEDGFHIYVNGQKVGDTQGCMHDQLNKIYPDISKITISSTYALMNEFSWTTTPGLVLNSIYFVSFLKSRTIVEKCFSYKPTIKVCINCFSRCPCFSIFL